MSTRSRGLLRSLSTLLVVAGAVLLLDAGVTLAWQEPLSALYTSMQQDRLDDDLREREQRPVPPSQLETLARLTTDQQRVAFLSRQLRREAKEGDALGRIRMPSIDSDTVIVQGVNPDDLREGPGHYPESPLPGTRGTVALAGHRTTYGAPFRRLDDLDRGDRVELEMPYGTFVYEVEKTSIVQPEAVEVTRRVSYDRLVLTACHPLYSAAQRIVAYARLVRTVQNRPLGSKRFRARVDE